MIFHEIYGAYYEAVGKIIRAALGGGLDRDLMLRIVRETAFQESVLSIPEALESGRWPFLGPGYAPRVRHDPVRPLTLIEKRWLKALLQDKRVTLFGVDGAGLEDVEPLFYPDDFVYFDRNAGGDPFGDPAYIAVFRSALEAVSGRKRVLIRLASGGESLSVFPTALEYSAGDDRFRLRFRTNPGKERAVGVSDIAECLPQEGPVPESPGVHYPTGEMVLLIRDERNALERVLLHFSHFKKKTERVGEGLYRMTMEYEKEDRDEMILRVLSFGPTVKVLSPPEIREGLIGKIKQQLRIR